MLVKLKLKGVFIVLVYGIWYYMVYGIIWYMVYGIILVYAMTTVQMEIHFVFN